MDRRFAFLKKKIFQGVVCPCPGALNMCMTIIFLSETAWPIKVKLYVEHC